MVQLSIVYFFILLIFYICYKEGMENPIVQLGSPFRIVVVDDDEKIIETITVFLEEEDNIDFYITQDTDQALELIREHRPHAVLTDLKMPKHSGLEILKQTKKLDSEIEVILMTAHASAQSAVEAMKEGAYDYIIKPFKIIELRSILSKIAKEMLLEQQNRSLQEKLERYEGKRRLIGSSTFIKELKKMIKVVADNTATILISGESGTGKSLLAELIHRAGNRARFPFVTIECAAIPGELLESELFGYEKGAFTGADKQKIGRMEQAQRGTLFLDEIGDMPLALQAKMLRVLQERELSRLGGTKSIPIDVRIISATNKDLSLLIESGGFREDLFYRLNVIPIRMESLRERPQDIPELVEHLLGLISRRLGRKPPRVAPAVMERIMQYEWPGNIRELENTLERSLILHPGDTLDSLLIEDMSTDRENYLTLEQLRQMPLAKEGLDFARLEELLLAKALEKCQGSKKQAARLLAVDEGRFGKMANSKGKNGR